MYHINCVDEKNHQMIEKNHQTMEKTAAHADEKNYQMIEEPYFNDLKSRKSI